MFSKHLDNLPNWSMLVILCDLGRRQLLCNYSLRHTRPSRDAEKALEFRSFLCTKHRETPEYGKLWFRFFAVSIDHLGPKLRNVGALGSGSLVGTEMTAQLAAPALSVVRACGAPGHRGLRQPASGGCC